MNASYALTESSFLRVNNWNNHSFKEADRDYLTMLEYSVPFSSTNQSGTNLATSSYDVGNKMTLNGIPVKNIANFFVSYYDAGNDGKMILFRIPESNISPTNNYTYTTIFIPKGMQVYDCVTKEDVTLRLINDGWCPSFGDDIPFLTKRPVGISPYGMDGGYTVSDATDVGYINSDNRVLCLNNSTNGCTAASLDFTERNIEVSRIKSITFKVKFACTSPSSLTLSEFRITNDNGAHWVLQCSLMNVVYDTWYTLTLNADKTLTTDIPGASSTTCDNFTRFGTTLGIFCAGVRFKPNDAGMALTMGDVIVDVAERESSSFVKVNQWNNNTYSESEQCFSTMLEFDSNFAETNKANINLATAEYDLGNKMTLNGTAIKNIPNFFAAYYYAGDVNTPMIWFKIPEAYNVPSGDFEFATINIPEGTVVFDLKVQSTVTLSIINDKWTVPLTQCSFTGVNKWNNNKYDATNKIYSTMLDFDKNFAESSKLSINLAVSTQELGNKMTFNGVAVKDIPNFTAVYYYAADIKTSTIWFNVPEAYIEPSGGYSHTTLFMPKGTIIFDGITKNDLTIFLSNGSWIVPDKWSVTSDHVDDYDYSFAVVGDTQDINLNASNDYHKIYDWIVDNKYEKNIAYTIGLGDITEKDYDEEWGRARESFDKLEAANMKHIQVRGNHDTQTKFNDFFMADDYYKNNVKTYEDSILNHYSKFRVCNNNYLVLALDYGPTDDALEWANDVVEDNPDYNVIVVTHGYLYRDGTRLGIGDDLNPSSSATDNINNGDEIWDKFVKLHENIVMVLSGHIYCENVLVT